MTKECDNCGSEVSNNFHRVFSDNRGVLHGCQHCTTKAARKNPVGESSL